MPRGGKRPGAGGRKGNRNASKHLRYSRSFWLREAMGFLSDAAALAVGARVRRGDPEALALVERIERKDCDAWRELPTIAAQWSLEKSGVSILHPVDGATQAPDERPGNDQTAGPSAFVYQQHQQQENDQRAGGAILSLIDGTDRDLIDRTVARLTEWDFRPGPRLWLRTHEDWLADVIECLDRLDSMTAAELRQLDHPMKYLVGSVHLEHAVEVVSDPRAALVCPFRPRCQWRRSGVGEHEVGLAGAG